MIFDTSKILNHMEENLAKAKDEVKRVDHLLFVSLKYTRTVDVIRSTLERIMNSYEFCFNALLEQKKHKKLIANYPSNIGLKSELMRDLFKDDLMVVGYVDFYIKLRKVFRAQYTRREEYRRHVTMIANLEGERIETNIDILREYFDKLKEFVQFVEISIRGKKED